MTKAALVEQLSVNRAITKKAARHALEFIFTALAREVRKGGRVVMPGFGVFFMKRRKARKILAFKSGALRMEQETRTLPEHWEIGFRASKEQKGTGDGPA